MDFDQKNLYVSPLFVTEPVEWSGQVDLTLSIFFFFHFETRWK